MSIISIPNVYSNGQVIDAGQLNANLSTIYNDYNGNINNSNLSPSIAIADSKLSQITTAAKVSGTALTNFASIPSGAGIIPAANLNFANVAMPYIRLSNTQSQNTAGGTATSGSWIAVPINTTDIDTGSNVVSNSGGTFVLSAGTYFIDAVCPFYDTSATQTRLYNTTASTVIALGETIIANDTTTNTNSRLVWYFTVTASQSLQFQYQVSSTRATNGLGVAANFAAELYATISMFRAA